MLQFLQHHAGDTCESLAFATGTPFALRPPIVVAIGARTTVGYGGASVRALQERMASIEGRMDESSQMVDGLRDSIAALDRRVTALDEKVDRRFEAIDRRFEAIDRRFEALDLKIDRNAERLEIRMSRQFNWLVGIQVTVLLAVVTALIAR